DIKSWRPKDLGAIARMMDNSERRLDLGRAGPQTRGLQRRILDRLDELIKPLERPQPPGPGPGAGPGASPTAPGPQPGPAPGPGPATVPGGGYGPDGKGDVHEIRLQELARRWGDMPAKEREAAMVELTRNLPPRYREIVENYFRRLNESPPAR